VQVAEGGEPVSEVEWDIEKEREVGVGDQVVLRVLENASLNVALLVCELLRVMDGVPVRVVLGVTEIVVERVQETVKDRVWGLKVKLVVHD